MSPRIPPLAVTAFTATSALGVGCAALQSAVVEERSGLRPNDFGAQPLPTWIGRVQGLEDPHTALPAALSAWDCRNHRLAWLGLQADGFDTAVADARRRHGPHRVALVVGTATSSVGATEAAYHQLDAEGQFPLALRSTTLHTPHALAAFLQSALSLSGPCLTISTACSSSAKAFAAAERLLRLGLADAVVVGGADTLCGNVLFGFHALRLVSPDPCRPFDARRSGINLGESAGFALLERAGEGATLQFLGYGESSDAHHMSTPHPLGVGAERALDQALDRAGLDASEVDHINLHGTASAKNDDVEAALVARRFGAQVHASSTKGFTGHTLGAAGILEAVFCLQALDSGLLPGMPSTQTLDPACGPQVRIKPARRAAQVALSHSFGFGGTNCVLAFARPGFRSRVAQAGSNAGAGP